MQKYKGYYIWYEPKPIPIVTCDYSFCHFDYDGPEDTRCGFAESTYKAMCHIDEIEEELGENDG